MKFASPEFASVYRRLAAFAPISQDDWRPLEVRLRNQELKKGDALIRAGDSPIQVAFVLSGMLRSFYISKTGGEFVKNFSKENEFISDYRCAILNQPAELYIDAIEESKVVTVPYPVFAKLFESSLTWSTIGRRLAETFYIVREGHARDLLLTNGAERFREFQKQFPYLVGKVPQKYIAQYLGISEVSLSRIRSQTRHKVT